jgi:uncharacterized protein (TIGR02302 family)
MTLPPPPGEPSGKLRLARAAVWAERAVRRVWPVACVILVFLALAFLGVFEGLNPYLHAGLIGIFLAALVFAWRRVRPEQPLWPSAQEGWRRLERDSGLTHRPFETLHDHLPAHEHGTAKEALWHLHRERVRRRLRTLRLRWPHADLAAHDPYALRSLVGLLFTIGLVAGWGDLGPRLAASVVPGFSGGGNASLDVWVTPPAYTGLAPIVLTPPEPAAAESAAPLKIPAGSVLTARLVGARGVVNLLANGQTKEMQRDGSGAFTISETIERGDSLGISIGRQLVRRWDITLLADAAPRIEFAGVPEKTPRSTLRVEYRAEDDYGIERVDFIVRLGLLGETPPSDEEIEVRLPLSGADRRSVGGRGFPDLTAHPWAGLPVRARLVATDAAGNVGRSEPAAFTLPERIFTHPLARALIDIRKTLTMRPNVDRVMIARQMLGLAARPEAYGDDPVVFLALRSGATRLARNVDPQTVRAVQDLLWDTALHLEDGGLTTAAQDLQAAQESLEEALAKEGVSREEIERLTQELQAAMDRFMDALEQYMREQMAQGRQLPELPPNLQAQALDRSMLQQMIDQIRNLAQTGAREAAQQLLSQLQQMLQNLQTGMQPGMQQSMQAFQDLQKLNDLARRQQALMDRTFQEAQRRRAEDGQRQGRDGQSGQEGQAGQQPGQEGQAGQQPGQAGQNGQPGRPSAPQGGAGSGLFSEEQAALRRELGELMQRLGEATGGQVPQPFGQADQAMRRALDQLQGNQPGGAVPQQGQAIEALQQALQQMAAQLSQQMQQMMGQGMMPGLFRGSAQSSPMNEDPLGRRQGMGGWADQSDVGIPSEADVQRAREILDELRRRSGDFRRPQIEREYIDRLLRQF